MVEQSILVWGLDGINVENYLFFGQLESTGKGGPVQLSPELERKVDEEAARIRAENPSLPQSVEWS